MMQSTTCTQEALRAACEALACVKDVSAHQIRGVAA